MALEITYWTGTTARGNVPRDILSSESLTISGTSAQTGVTPPTATIISIYATENARIAYADDADTPTADASSAYVAAGERLWLMARAGYKIAGITA